uniref:hypothetical protein n=1 Tax=Deinococcus apachensis TaxID=309886 RepID=UPI00058BBFF2
GQPSGDTERRKETTMNAHLYAAQDRAQELRAEARRDRDARAAQGQNERENLLQRLGVLLLARQPRLA